MPLAQAKMTADEYLIWESAQAERHEFYEGEVFAMTGGNLRHNRTIQNVARLISSHLEGTPCCVFTENVKVQVGEIYVYPDTVVTCEALKGDDLFLTQPKFISEVLSANTQGYDRGKKFGTYRRLTSLLEYALIDASEKRVETYVRQTDGHWLYLDQGENEHIAFASIDMLMPSAEVFRGFD